LETIDDLCDKVGLLRDGQIDELDKSKSQAAWMIRVVDYIDNGEWGKIIENNGGIGVTVNDNVWTFSVDESDKSIPAIITALVNAGCGIYEVQKKKSDFSDAIKTIYK
jgi:ABC-type multidrug transport system ATPase subunit